jgi:uncharacterized membrane protein YdfJ with MMPL/SSD domain
MVLVPATMSMLGRWNWWLPAWMDRVLPQISVDLPARVEGDLVAQHAPAPSDEDDRTLAGV